jgi:hypothetical protein
LRQEQIERLNDLALAIIALRRAMLDARRRLEGNSQSFRILAQPKLEI